MQWTDKYFPKTTSEIQGQNKAIELTRELLNKKKPILFYGPVGTGKTCTAHALANELGKEIFEVNASDVRNKEQIESIVGSAMLQQSLISFGKGKIILLDEIDGLSGVKDRGGIQALEKLLPKSKYPVILTANDPYDKKFANLRKKTEMVEFHTLAYTSIFVKLKDICEKENIVYEEELLRDLSRRAGGDMRAAITDLQLCTTTGTLNLDVISERNRTENMLQALMKVFKTTNADIARNAFIDVNEDTNQQMLWVEENLPREYEGEDLARGFEALSMADVFTGRIRRWQHWRFLVYVNHYLTANVALAKKEKYKKFVTYKPTSRILKLWMANMKYNKRKDIAAKIAEKCHTSKKRAIKEILPYVQKIIQQGKMDLIKYFDFNTDEVMWLKK